MMVSQPPFAGQLTSLGPAQSGEVPLGRPGWSIAACHFEQSQISPCESRKVMQTAPPERRTEPVGPTCATVPWRFMDTVGVSLGLLLGS